MVYQMSRSLPAKAQQAELKARSRLFWPRAQDPALLPEAPSRTANGRMPARITIPSQTLTQRLCGLTGQVAASSYY